MVNNVAGERKWSAINTYNNLIHGKTNIVNCTLTTGDSFECKVEQAKNERRHSATRASQRSGMFNYSAFHSSNRDSHTHTHTKHTHTAWSRLLSIAIVIH